MAYSSERARYGSISPNYSAGYAGSNSSLRSSYGSGSYNSGSMHAQSAGVNYEKRSCGAGCLICTGCKG
jgi:hypothetical protein